MRARQLRFQRLSFVFAVLVFLSGCASNPKSNDWEDQKSYGASMAGRGFWREALFRFERANELKPNDAEILNNLGVAYEALGESAKALAAYRRALELSPDDTQIKRNYARFAEYYAGAQRTATTPPVVR